MQPKGPHPGVHHDHTSLLTETGSCRAQKVGGDAQTRGSSLTFPLGKDPGAIDQCIDCLRTAVDGSAGERGCCQVVSLRGTHPSSRLAAFRAKLRTPLRLQRGHRGEERVSKDRGWVLSKHAAWLRLLLAVCLVCLHFLALSALTLNYSKL